MVNIPAAEITAEVDRILVSKGFANAGRLSRLLRYIVEKTVAGEANQLKEYSSASRCSIATRNTIRGSIQLCESRQGACGAGSTVLQRRRRGVADSHQPAAWRLRCAVEPRVESAGSSRRPPSPDLGPLAADRGADLRRGRHGRVARRLESHAISVGTVGGRPRLHAVDAGIRGCRAGITHDRTVTTELARLGTVGVASYTSAMQFAGQRKPIPEISAVLNAPFILEASIERESTGLLVSIRIVDGQTDRKVWVSDYRGAANDVRGISQRIAFDVSAELLRLSRP